MLEQYPVPKNFEEFWPIYVHQHMQPGTRVMHFIGTTLTLVFLAVSVFTMNPWWLLGLPVGGYFFAWVSHFTVEKNRPATFRYPFYSLAGDYKMYCLTCLGKMGREVESARQRFAGINEGSGANNGSAAK
jgi:hypothetical protein